MYYFVNDTFNVEGFAYLGRWNLNDHSKGNNLIVPYFLTDLFNADFRKFSNKHGYGRDFPVLSRLHEVEDFEPKCVRYHFEKKPR